MARALHTNPAAEGPESVDATTDLRRDRDPAAPFGAGRRRRAPSCGSRFLDRAWPRRDGSLAVPQLCSTGTASLRHGGPVVDACTPPAHASRVRAATLAGAAPFFSCP